MTDTHSPRAEDGLWQQNPVLVQMLGLCPLLAVSNTLVNAVALGLATLWILLLSNTLVALSRRQLRKATRVATSILIIATAVSSLDILLQALFYSLHQNIGLFIPLIVTNCMILARAESYAHRHSVARAARDGLWQGLGALWVMALLGALREVLGRGTLLANAHLLFGEGARDWTVHFPQPPLLIFILPPGAFIVLALLVAVHRRIASRHKNTAMTHNQGFDKSSSRAAHSRP